MKNDPRLFPRFPYRTNAVLICLPCLHEVTLIDICAHGALVRPEGNTEIRVGDQTRLRVLTEKGNQAFEVEALVAHRSDQGIGVEFGCIDHHAKSTLQRLIEMNLGTSDLAARTLPALLDANFCAAPAPPAALARSRCTGPDAAGSTGFS
jgi:hypothetical protein